MAGSLPSAYPGQRLAPIEEVKAEFRVSKQPVMDAMRRLEQSGSSGSSRRAAAGSPPTPRRRSGAG
jgi:DNA-binding GntR family transcriptional regulator